MEQCAGKFNCRRRIAGLLNDEFEGVAVALDMAGGKMPADHKRRPIGKTGK